MPAKKRRQTRRPPLMFRPLLWSFSWDDLDINEDKEDIIINTVNNGRLDHWSWLIKTYGKQAIRNTLKNRLASEFHPESLNLAKVIFNLPKLLHARRGANSQSR